MYCIVSSQTATQMLDALPMVPPGSEELCGEASPECRGLGFTMFYTFFGDDVSRAFVNFAFCYLWSAMLFWMVRHNLARTWLLEGVVFTETFITQIETNNRWNQVEWVLFELKPWNPKPFVPRHRTYLHPPQVVLLENLVPQTREDY